MDSLAQHHHFLEIMAGTYGSKIKNMRLDRLEYEDTQFVAAFPVERAPKHPLSGISTRSGDLARFTFKNLNNSTYISSATRSSHCRAPPSACWTQETMSLARLRATS